MLIISTIKIMNGGGRMVDEQYILTNKVMIVDDSEINRVILSQIFEPNYEIIQAEDGIDGLEKIKENKVYVLYYWM